MLIPTLLSFSNWLFNSNLGFGWLPYRVPPSMPGAIHVSVVFNLLPVLDFKDLPSSSLLVKVSMGKREYQTWDKGEFSFPLTTLRDNVTITLWDVEGNEMSHRVVQTLLVLEKGSWDDFIPLEGGGQVHMNMQFVLSEEERNRIRSMRESAMKKKYGEQLSSGLRCSEMASSAGGILVSSSFASIEVSGCCTSTEKALMLSGLSSQDSLKCGTHNEVVSNRDLSAGVLSNSKHDAGKHERKFPVTQIFRNDTDGSEETSSTACVSKRRNVHLGEINHSNSVEQIGTWSFHLDDPERHVYFQDTPSTTEKTSVASILKNWQADQLEKQEPLEKTSSNDMRVGMKPSPSKLHSDKVGPEAHIEVDLKKINQPGKLPSGRLKNPFLTGELQHIQVYKTLREDSHGSKFSQDSGQLKEPSAIQIEPMTKHKKPLEHLVRIPEVEATTVSQSMDKGRSFPANQLGSSSGTFMEGNAIDIRPTDSHEIYTLGSSEDKLKSAAFFENDNLSSEIYDTWIFPDHAKRLCITTGSKQIMDLVGSCGIQERVHKSEQRCQFPENVEKFSSHKEVKKGGRTSPELRKSTFESSLEDETARGPMGQAIKVAIMIAFGTLVLLTRQRKPR
ncbi:uncharacterized protein LOC127797210 isoform X6 [Diospyros lotus]|uniref:uncharacterized protein LOC127797210 isoform X6 n=1 Tax=Diospyros lotus TaxID=55363 RepID=UPI00225B655E|nr:uncharacterized protein LOC127797210 isoform X6 [Diospyros lotus]